VVVMVEVHVQWTHLEEGKKEEVDFHPHNHHLKNKLEYEQNMAQHQ
jgi:hypothetical protein